MTRVDRYIIVEFLRVFFICFATFLGLFVVADFVNHFDELTRYAETTDGMARALYAYYGPKVPWFFDFVGRLVALVSAIFAITSLQKNNEMAAMMAAGISRWRIVKPLVICVIVMAVLAALNRELLIPRLGARVYQDARTLTGDRTEGVRAQYDHATGIFMDGSGLSAQSKTIQEPVFDLPKDLAPSGTQIVGKQAHRLPAHEDRPGGYVVLGVDPARTTVQQSIVRDDKVIIYHPGDADWLAKDQLFVVTDLPFEQLRDRAHWKQSASTWSLLRAARNNSLDTGADVSVAIHTRIVQPVVDILVLFLGLPIVLSRESRNAFIAVGSCMLMVATFIVSMIGLQSLGMGYVISPSLAVWAPILIFLPIAVWMSEPLRR
jgi:lipopolysaccharide export system permease protein